MVIIMSSTDVFYTYILFDPFTKRYYIGSRRAKGIKDPYADNYRGSSKIAGWKQRSKTMRKRILGVFPTARQALLHEIYLHELHDVGRNKRYYNQVKQTSKAFDTSGNPGHMLGKSHSVETEELYQRSKNEKSVKHIKGKFCHKSISKKSVKQTWERKELQK